MTQERRKRSRVNLEFPLTISFEGKQVRGVVQDLSLKGLSCATEEWILPGKECEVTLELESGLRMHIHGRIIRAGTRLVSFEQGLLRLVRRATALEDVFFDFQHVGVAVVALAGGFQQQHV